MRNLPFVRLLIVSVDADSPRRPFHMTLNELTRGIATNGRRQAGRTGLRRRSHSLAATMPLDAEGAGVHFTVMLLGSSRVCDSPLDENHSVAALC